MVLTLSRIKIWSTEKYSPYFQKRSKNKSHYFLSLDTHLNAIIKLILNRSVAIHRYSKKTYCFVDANAMDQFTCRSGY